MFSNEILTNILLVIICVTLSYILGMTIIKVIDKRLSHFEIKLPKQNIIVKLNDQYDSSFKSVIPKKKVIAKKPKKETYTDIEPITGSPIINLLFKSLSSVAGTSAARYWYLFSQYSIN